MRRRALLLGAAGVLLIGVLAVVAFSGGTAAEKNGSTDPAAFDLPALHGPGRVRLADYRGTPVVVNMFASWCSNCRDELPLFARTALALRGRVQFVGVNSQETGDGAAMANEFHLQASGFVLARDIGGSPAEGLHDALGARGMPVTAFYSAQGRLLRTYRAQVPESVLRSTLQELYGIST